MTQWVFAASLIFVLGMLSACLKESAATTGARKMVIAFNSQSIPFESVDSAAAIFSKQGSLTPYYLRFIRQNGSYEVSMEDFTSGVWTVDVLLYSKKDTAGKSFQYTAGATIDVSQISGVLLGAPDKAASAVWKKNIVLSASNNEVIGISPLDLSNPSFTMIANNNKWDSFSVRKVAYQTVGSDTAVVMSKTWSCGGNCLGSDGFLQDSTYFADFSQYVKARSWDRGFVEVRFKDNETNEVKTFNHDWSKQ